MRLGWGLLSLCIGLSACASVPVIQPTKPAAVRAPDRDLLELALVASGYESPAARRAARKEVEARLAPVLAEVSREPVASARPPLLLTSLHRHWLARYDARATTLADAIESGTFNCLSASVLYNLAAERLGISVRGELLPTHARSIVEFAGGRRVIVEATSARGFDPDPETLRDILGEVSPDPTAVATAGQRAIVASSGAIVESWVLAGTIFVNRASLAQEAGDLEGAERLFERGERLAASEGTRRVLRDQRAALLAQLAAADLLSGDAHREARALRSLFAARALDPSEPDIRATVEQNLRAAAERHIIRAVEADDEQRILALITQFQLSKDGAQARRSHADGATSPKADPSTVGALTAFAWSEIGRLRAQKNDLEGTLAAIDRGLEADLAAGDEHIAGVLHHNRFTALRRYALSKAKSGELQKSLEIVQRLSQLPGLTAEQKKEAALDQAKVVQIAAERRSASGDRRGAVELYRKAVALAPKDEIARHNLVAGLQQFTIEAVNAGRCADVQAELDELRRIDNRDAFVDRAEARCAMITAGARLDAQDPAGAVEELRRARALRPSDPVVARNLGLGLHALARSLIVAGDCARARPHLDEARALGINVSSLEASCR